MALVRERERGTLEQLLVSPLSPAGLMLGKLVPYLCIGMAMAVVLFLIMRFVFFVPIEGNIVAMLFSTLVYVFALAQSGFAHRDLCRKPNASVANVDGVPVAERFLFGFHFPARNDALDFLCARHAFSHDLFHRADARHHFAGSKSVRILAESCDSHFDVELAFCSLRLAVSKKDCVSVKRVLFSAFRVALAVAAIIALLWWFGIKMPGKNISKAAPLSPDEVTLREELRADVQKLAGEIGERNMWHYPQLNAAADFIENSFSRAGLHPRRDSYELRGQACHNIETEIRGSRPEIILIGAHYDSVFGSPGANDNGSGVAAMLALARRFAGERPANTPCASSRS